MQIINGDSKLHCVYSNLDAVLAAGGQGKKEKKCVGEIWISSTVRKILLFIFNILFFFVSSMSVAILKPLHDAGAHFSLEIHRYFCHKVI